MYMEVKITLKSSENEYFFSWKSLENHTQYSRSLSHFHNIPYKPLIRGSVGGQLGWRLGVMASVVRRMNEVTIHWARLVLEWVTVFGRVYHHGV